MNEERLDAIESLAPLLAGTAGVSPMVADPNILITGVARRLYKWATEMPAMRKDLRLT